MLIVGHYNLILCFVKNVGLKIRMNSRFVPPVGKNLFRGTVQVLQTPTTTKKGHGILFWIVVIVVILFVLFIVAAYFMSTIVLGSIGTIRYLDFFSITGGVKVITPSHSDGKAPPRVSVGVALH